MTAVAGCQFSAVSKDRQDVDRLVQLLSDVDAETRARAGAALVSRQGDYAGRMIGQVLEQGGDPRARIALVDALGMQPRLEYLSRILAMLWDSNHTVADAAARALALYGYEAVGKQIVSIVQDKRAPVYTRELALRVLGQSGRPEVIAGLIPLLKDEKLRPAAIEALRRLTQQDLSTAEEWSRWWTLNRNKTQAEWLTAKIGQLEDRIAQLMKDLEQERKRRAALEDRLADSIVKSLDARANKNDPAPLVAALDEPLVKVRRYAVDEIARLGVKEAAPALAALLIGDSDPVVRAGCARTLGLIGDEKSVEVLEEAMDESDEDVVVAATSALGKLKAKSSVPRLLLALLSDSAAARGAAAESLGQIESAEAVPPLVELLRSDRETSVREQAARALGMIKDKHASAALEKALADPSPAVRVYAINALGELKDAGIAPTLCTMLDEETNASVREAAVVALGKVGGEPAVTCLSKLLRMPQEKQAQLAFSSIVSICARNVELLESTAEALGKSGLQDQSLKLYELLVQHLAAQKDDQRLGPAKMKLAEGYMAQAQWGKALPLLEDLSKASPDDAAVAERHARTLTELKKFPEAYRVYARLASRNKATPWWKERLALLEAMAQDKQFAEGLKLTDEALKGDPTLPDDVKKKLESLRDAFTGMADDDRAKRAAEMKRLVADLASDPPDVKQAAKTKLAAQPEDAYPHLVDALESDNEKVRRAASDLLRELSGQDFGYRPEAKPEENAAAVAKWKEWLKARAAKP